MDLEQLFPLNRRIDRQEPRTLLFALCLYLAVCAVLRVADWLLGWVPILGSVLGVIFWLIGLYCTVGVILALLQFFRADR